MRTMVRPKEAAHHDAVASLVNRTLELDDDDD
jgi:hypothetical protein